MTVGAIAAGVGRSRALPERSPGTFRRLADPIAELLSPSGVLLELNRNVREGEG